MRIGAAGKWFISGIIVTSNFFTTATAQQLDQKVGQKFDQKLYSEMRWRCIGPFRGAAPWPSPECRISRMFSTWLPSTAGVWKTTDFETPGIRFSTTSLPAPSAHSPLPRPIRTSFTLAAVKDCSARILRPRWHLQITDAENHGRTLVQKKGSPRRAANHGDSRRPKRSQPRFRRRRRTSLRSQRGARRFSFDRRRANFPESSLQDATRRAA